MGYMTKLSLPSLILIFSFFGCSTQQQNHAPRQVAPQERVEHLRPRPPRQQSAAIERAFRDIERESVQQLERARAVEYYERLRLQEQQNPQLIEERRQRMLEQERRENALRRQQQEAQRPPVVEVEVTDPHSDLENERGDSTTGEVSPLMQVDPDDNVLLEAKQHMDYFCIRYESHSRWRSGETCEEFTFKQMDFCRERWRAQRSFNFVQCLRGRLKI